MEAAYVVSFVIPTNGDPPVMVVGRRENKAMKVVNAISGDEVIPIYKKIVGDKETQTNLPMKFLVSSK